MKTIFLFIKISLWAKTIWGAVEQVCLTHFIMDKDVKWHCELYLTHRFLGGFNSNFQYNFSDWWGTSVELTSDECQWTLLVTSQHWFRKWLGAVRQQAVTRTNIDPDPCRHMASLYNVTCISSIENVQRFWKCFPEYCPIVWNFRNCSFEAFTAVKKKYLSVSLNITGGHYHQYQGWF